MLTPVQATPIPLEPARQQLTPPLPEPPPPPPPQAEMPLQASDTPQDKFEQDGGQWKNREDQAQQDQQRAEAVGKMRLAWARLNELRMQAGAALRAGDAARAKVVAQEAAMVASDIRDLATSLPVVNVGAIQAAADQLAQLPQQSNLAASAVPAPVTIDVPAALDTARAGLGTAKEVVDTAASIPYHPVEDRIAITAMRHQVMDAMAGVEAVAAKVADANTPPTRSPAGQIDIKA